MSNNFNTSNDIDLLFSELKSLIDKSGISLSQISENLSAYNSRQAFGRALDAKTIRIGILFEIANIIGKRMVVRFVDKDLPDEAILNEPVERYLPARISNDESNQLIEQLRSNVVDLRDTVKTQKHLIKLLSDQLSELKGK